MSDPNVKEACKQFMDPENYDTLFPEKRPGQPNDEIIKTVTQGCVKLAELPQLGVTLMATFYPLDTHWKSEVKVEMRDPDRIKTLRELASTKGTSGALKDPDLRVIMWFSKLEDSARVPDYVSGFEDPEPDYTWGS